MKFQRFLHTLKYYVQMVEIKAYILLAAGFILPCSTVFGDCEREVAIAGKMKFCFKSMSIVI